MKAINKTSVLFPPKVAEDTARTLNSIKKDNWVYKVKHDPTEKGFSFIEIYDENGNYISKL